MSSSSTTAQADGWPNGCAPRVTTSSTRENNPIRAIERAAAEGRILVTLDRDFGRLVYVGGAMHAGLVRLPDVPVRDRLALMAEVLQEHGEALDRQALVTVRGGRIRVTGPHR